MGLQGLLLALVAVVYAGSAFGYAANFYHKSAFRGRLATWGGLLGWAIHTLLLVQITVDGGQVPLTSQVLPTLCAWLVVIVYGYLEVTTQDRSLGALIMPLVVVLHLFTVSNLSGQEAIVQVVPSGGWFKLHVLAYILAYAAFAISCVSAMMYLMLLGEIQKKHLGFFYERLPSLDILNQINNRAATFGFLFLSGGSIASAVWAYEELARLSHLPILITWVIYAGNLIARGMGGWQGKRAAFLSIAGFCLVIFAFPVVGVLFQGKHPLGP